MNSNQNIGSLNQTQHVAAQSNIPPSDPFEMGWNNLTEEFNNQLQKWQEEFVASVVNKNAQKQNKCLENIDIQQWYRGDIILDPKDQFRTAVISNDHLMNILTQCIEKAQFKIIHQLWKDNPRLHELLKHQSVFTQHYWLSRLVCTNCSIQFCYDFISIYTSKETFFDYLKLINNSEIVQKLLLKLKNYNYTPNYQWLLEWVKQISMKPVTNQNQIYSVSIMTTTSQAISNLLCSFTSPTLPSSPSVQQTINLPSEEEISLGWNVLSSGFNNVFKCLLAEYKNILLSLDYRLYRKTDAKEFLAKNVIILDWVRGSTIYDLTDSKLSARISGVDLIGAFKFLLLQNFLVLACMIWESNSRLHNLFLQIQNKIEQSFYWHVIMKSGSLAFKRQFLAIHPNKDSLLKYLNLIDDPELTTKVFEFIKTSMTHSHLFHYSFDLNLSANTSALPQVSLSHATLFSQESETQNQPSAVPRPSNLIN